MTHIRPLAAVNDERALTDIPKAVPAGVIALSVALAFLIPNIATLAVPALHGIAGIYLIRRRAPAQLVQLTLASYAFMPLVRRVVDWQDGFTDPSPILIAPTIPCLACALILLRPFRMDRAAAAPVWTFLVISLFGCAVGLLLNGSVAVITSFLKLIAPALLALVVLANAKKAAESVLAGLVPLARWLALGMGAYGLVQFLVLPPWDAAWMRSVEDIVYSIGAAEPLSVRVYSTGSSPGPTAGLITFALLILMTTGAPLRRPVLDAAAIGAGVTTLGLTQVRASWLVLLLCILLIGSRRPRVLRGVLVLAAVVTPLGMLAAGPVIDTISGRLTDTVAAGSQDTSLQARLSFQAAQLPVAISQPLGQGVGSSGAAARIAGGDAAFTDVDSGYLELFRVFGAVGASVLIGVFGLMSWRAWQVAGRPPNHLIQLPLLGAAATVVITPANLLFAAPQDANAALLWVLWASLAVVRSNDKPRAPRHAVTRMARTSTRTK
ncbi:hypothetical protein KUM42_12085 [Modestobacter sp. L9-4]|uniref:O-antigen ligase family protein n=1 Tax=Modestobacter sp. L9-4 TaxID=2851567 RepID=UPI001C77C18A|nr:O-antigen ligase family protein [Modestobacter sp. L9-4]QXG74626.1 hypothetical protein KUM42_12085 [Modestobacter sp. L9-4]